MDNSSMFHSNYRVVNILATHMKQKSMQIISVANISC